MPTDPLVPRRVKVRAGTVRKGDLLLCEDGQWREVTYAYRIEGAVPKPRRDYMALGVAPHAYPYSHLRDEEVWHINALVEVQRKKRARPARPSSPRC